MNGTTEVVQSIVAALKESAVFKWMEHKMNQARGRNPAEMDDLDDDDWLEDCPDGSCPVRNQDDLDDLDDDDLDEDDDLDDDDLDDDLDDPLTNGEDDDLHTQIGKGINSGGRWFTKPRRSGVEKYARKPLGGGHSRFPDSLYGGDLNIHDVTASRWEEMSVPGGQPEHGTPNRTHHPDVSKAAEELASRFFEREDVSSDGNHAAEDYIVQSSYRK